MATMIMSSAMVEHRRSPSVGPPPEWAVAIRESLKKLDERALIILEERVLRYEDSSPTLQELGDRFGLSRERIRQIESKARETVVKQAGARQVVVEACDRVRAHLGAVFTRHDLARELNIPIDGLWLPIEVQVVLFLAGPYRSVGGTFTSGGLDIAVRAALAPVSAGPAPLDEVRASMRHLGVRDDQQLRLLGSRRDVRVLDDHVVPWSGTLADKAAVILGLAGRVMVADEIHEQLAEGSLRTLKNYLGSDDRFRRRGPNTWGLADWGGETYESIATEMADELRGYERGMPVDKLKRLLDDKFGIRAASVEIMTATHPMFVRDGAWVRLRTADEPYVPDAAIEESRDCMVVDGCWAMRHKVNYDTLRGSGHAIPEPFAAHIRLFPTSHQSVPSDFGPISFYWPAQSPGIGSLRRVAEGLKAEDGDYLFVLPLGVRIEFQIVRHSELANRNASQQLLLRLGQAGQHDPWLPVCAQALGLPPHARSDEIDELLEIRGDRDVLRLFRAALRREVN